MFPRSRLSAVTLNYLGIAIATVILCYDVAYFLHWQNTIWQLEDFSHYYATAWLALHHQIPYGVSFTTLPLSTTFNWHPQIMMATNPPFLVFLTMPLALFEPKTAWYVWLGFTSVARILIPIILLKALGPLWTIRQRVLITLMYFASWPLWSEIEFSQVQSVMLFLVVCGWYRYRLGNVRSAAVLWGAATAIKFLTWPFLLFLVFAGQLRAATIAAMSFIVLSLIPVIFFGNSIYISWSHFALPLINEWTVRSPLNASVIAAILREMGQRFVGNDPVQPIDFRLLYLLSLGIATFACTWAVRKATSRSGIDLSCALLLIISFAVGPLAWVHYLLAYIPASVIVWSYSSRTVAWGAAMFTIWFCCLTRISFEGLRFIPMAVGLLPWITTGQFLTFIVALTMVCNMQEKEK